MSFRRTLILIVVLAWWAAPVAGASEPFEVSFAPDGAVIAFPRPTTVARIEVSAEGSGSEGDFRLVECLHQRPVTRHRLFFPVQGVFYTVEVFQPGGEPLVVKCQPSTSVFQADFAVVLQLPYTGRQDITRRWVDTPPRLSPLFPVGSRLTAEVEVMTWRRPVRGRLRLVLDEGLRPADSTRGWETSRDEQGRLVLTRGVVLGAPMQVVQFLRPVTVTGKEGERPEITAHFTPEVGRGRWTLTAWASVRIASADEVARRLRVVGVVMPTDAQGERDVRRERDTVLLPSRMGLALRRWLGFSEEYFDYYAPFAHQAILFENAGTQSLPLAVSQRVTHADDNAPVPGFRPPDYLASADGTFTVTAEIEPGGKTPVVLPVFVRPDRLLPGRYRAVIEARILGTDTVAARVEHPFQVRRTDLRALVVTAAAVVLSIAGLALFLARHRRIFAAFRVSELVLIALFATMTFVLVIFPGSLLGPVFSAVAGPFGFLIQGIFFEVLRVLVLVTLLVLVPRVGTVTLVSIVRYLIGGLAFGGFTPVDLFYLGASVILMEAALYAGGVTSKRGLLRRRDIGFATFVYVALLMGLVNGATQYVTYCLNISFYRLYFADWFIWLSVLVSGFLYAAAGTLPGLKLGLRLRRISD